MSEPCVPVWVLKAIVPTAELRVVLAARDRPMSRGALVDELQLSTGTVWKVVDRLSATGALVNVGHGERGALWMTATGRAQGATDRDQSATEDRDPGATGRAGVATGRDMGATPRALGATDSRPGRDEPLSRKGSSPALHVHVEDVDVMHVGDPAGVDERRELVQAMTAAGLDEAGAWKLAKTTSAEVIRRQLDLWPERRRDPRIRDRQRILYCSIRDDWPLERQAPAGRSAAMEARDAEHPPAPAACPECGSDDAVLFGAGRLISCGPCGITYPVHHVQMAAAAEA